MKLNQLNYSDFSQLQNYIESQVAIFVSIDLVFSIAVRHIGFASLNFQILTLDLKSTPPKTP